MSLVRPIMRIVCSKCSRGLIGCRVRGRWIGNVIVDDGWPKERWNILERAYVCLRCRKPEPRSDSPESIPSGLNDPANSTN